MNLRGSEKIVLRKLCLSFAPSGGALPVSADDVHLDAKVERFFILAGSEGMAGLRALLFVLEYLALCSRGTRFSRLPDDQAVDFLARLAASRSNVIQFVFLGLRGMLAPVFYAQPEVRAAMGVLPGCNHQC